MQMPAEGFSYALAPRTAGERRTDAETRYRPGF